MSRVHTRPNWDHPHYRLATFLQRQYALYRSMSNEVLTKLVEKNVVAVNATLPDEQCQPMPFLRTEQLRFLLELDEAFFKNEWMKVHGWPIDESTDPEKLARNALLEQENEKRQEAGLLPLLHPTLQAKVEAGKRAILQRMGLIPNESTCPSPTPAA